MGARTRSTPTASTTWCLSAEPTRASARTCPYPPGTARSCRGWHAGPIPRPPAIGAAEGRRLLLARCRLEPDLDGAVLGGLERAAEALGDAPDEVGVAGHYSPQRPADPASNVAAAPSRRCPSNLLTTRDISCAEVRHAVDVRATPPPMARTRARRRTRGPCPTWQQSRALAWVAPRGRTSRPRGGGTATRSRSRPCGS